MSARSVAKHCACGVSVGVLVLAAVPCSQARVYFQNEGTRSGWTSYTEQRAGTVTAVRSPAWRNTGTSLRCRQIFQSADGNRYHSEASGAGGYQPNGSDYYYGQVMWIQRDHVEVAVWQQFFMVSPKMPWIGFNIDGSRIYWDAVRGPMAPGGAAAFATYIKGTWVRIVTRLRMQRTGLLECWINGTKRLSKGGDFSSAFNYNSPSNYSTGLYIGWHNHVPTGPRDLSFYHDHIRVSSTHAEAEPNNW